VRHRLVLAAGRGVGTAVAGGRRRRQRGLHRRAPWQRRRLVGVRRAAAAAAAGGRRAKPCSSARPVPPQQRRSGGWRPRAGHPRAQAPAQRADPAGCPRARAPRRVSPEGVLSGGADRLRLGCRRARHPAQPVKGRPDEGGGRGADPAGTRRGRAQRVQRRRRRNAQGATGGEDCPAGERRRGIHCWPGLCCWETVRRRCCCPPDGRKRQPRRPTVVPAGSPGLQGPAAALAAEWRRQRRRCITRWFAQVAGQVSEAAGRLRGQG